jgi:hypothetical protein
MILGWSPFKTVSFSAVLYPRWPPWQKIEISTNGQKCSVRLWGPSWSKGRTAGHIFGREPSNDYFIKILFSLSKWFQTRRFVKIFLPCNFEVNPITNFGVIALFSSKCSQYPFFIKMFSILILSSYISKTNFDEKRAITPKLVMGFTSKLQGRKILTCCKFLQFKLNLYLL